jgi:CO/xanthine dehydrogenase Mo-binding subunit
MLKPGAPLKSNSDFKVLGQSLPRTDIPAKVFGTFEYIHNVSVPGMVHGRVIRPPSIGAKLLSVDDTELKKLKGARTAVRNDFLGVVAEREEDAIEAASLVKAKWTDTAPLPESTKLYGELVKQKVLSDRVSFETGDIAAGLEKGQYRLKAVYDFPFQSHAMIGPSCAIADVRVDKAILWSGSQWPHGDRSDIAKMLGLPLDRVELIWKEASGSYGRLGCDDAAADAAIMSQIVGKPVRVQWSRADEHVWEPVSPAMTMIMEGASSPAGQMTGFDYVQYSPSHSTGEKGNHLAWRLIGGAPGWGRMSGAAPKLWYDVPAKRARNIYVEPWLRNIYLRAPGGFQAIFAYESFVAELANLAGMDPLEFRLKNLTDARDIDVLKAVAGLSAWEPRANRSKSQDASILKGRGLAMARYGAGETRSSLVVDIEVERATGKIRVTHAYMAFDCGYVLNPDGALNQVEGGLLQGLSRTLHEEVSFDRKVVTSESWADYPILRFTEVPEVKIKSLHRPDLPWSSVAEAGTVTAAAAVANAVFDAAGKHPRRIPLRADYIRKLMSSG